MYMNSTFTASSKYSYLTSYNVMAGSCATMSTSHVLKVFIYHESLATVMCVCIIKFVTMLIV